MKRDSIMIAGALLIIVALAAISFTAQDITGSSVRYKIRPGQVQTLTKVYVSNDNKIYTTNEIDVGKGKYIYFRVETGYPYGTKAKYKLFFIPESYTSKKSSYYEDISYLEPCGQQKCGPGKIVGDKYLTTSLNYGKHCAYFEDIYTSDEIEVCFNVV